MRAFYLACAVLTLAGCATPDIGQSPEVTLAASNVLPTPSNLGPQGDYVFALGPYDKVAIEVAGVSEMVREVTIDGEGNLAFPLAGVVSAAGLTTGELALVLEERLRNSFMRNPQVSVNVVEQQSHVLTVEGQVNRPGVFPVTRELTLMQAVALAGGESENARTSSVLLFREVDGQQYVGLYNLQAIRYGNYPDPRVLPDDTVSVSASQTRQFLGSLQGVTGLLTTPLILLLRNN